MGNWTDVLEVGIGRRSVKARIAAATALLAVGLTPASAGALSLEAPLSPPPLKVPVLSPPAVNAPAASSPLPAAPKPATVKLPKPLSKPAAKTAKSASVTQVKALSLPSLPRPSSTEAPQVTVPAVSSGPVPVPTVSVPVPSLPAPRVSVPALPAAPVVIATPGARPATRSAGSAATSSSATSTTATGAGSTPPATATNPYGGAPPASAPNGAVLPAPGGAAPNSRRAHADRVLQQTVAQLKGCLGLLPPRIRLLLELRSGVGASHALSVAEAADYLSVRARSIVKLERHGLRLLRRRARSHGCATSPGTAVSAVGSTGPGSTAAVADASPPAAGSVLGLQAAKTPLGAAGALERRLLEDAARPAADSPVVVVLAILTGMLVIALIAADATGAGPRHRRWRRQLLIRFHRR